MVHVLHESIHLPLFVYTYSQDLMYINFVSNASADFDKHLRAISVRLADTYEAPALRKLRPPPAETKLHWDEGLFSRA